MSAIPATCEAEPGIKTYLDLPLYTGDPLIDYGSFLFEIPDLANPGNVNTGLPDLAGALADSVGSFLDDLTGLTAGWDTILDLLLDAMDGNLFGLGTFALGVFFGVTRGSAVHGRCFLFACFFVPVRDCGARPGPPTGRSG